jgi:hypothetical protein
LCKLSIKLKTMRTLIQELLDNLAQELKSNNSHQLVLDLTYAILERVREFPDEYSLVHHPLGFFVIKLGQINPSTFIRLHIWLPNRRTTQHPEWSIHNHTFTLKSHVLTGKIINNFFNVNFQSTQPTNCLYLVRYNDNLSILDRTSQYLSCYQTEQKNYVKGDYYLVEKGMYHSTQVPLEYLTSTIVITSNPEKKEPHVIGDLEGRDECIYHRTTAQLSEFQETLSLLQCKLKTNFEQANSRNVIHFRHPQGH